jgi:hypothetical protein
LARVMMDAAGKQAAEEEMMGLVAAAKADVTAS